MLFEKIYTVKNIDLIYCYIIFYNKKKMSLETTYVHIITDSIEIPTLDWFNGSNSSFEHIT